MTTKGVVIDSLPSSLSPFSSMPTPGESSTSPTDLNARNAEQETDQDPEKQPIQNVEHQPERFSVFTKTEKRAMVAVCSLAAFFSPLSSSIYFPALDTIAAALNVSTSKINITVTTYMILQGAAPMFIAGFSDTAGRRPAYIFCFIVYLAANLALGLQNSYAALLVLRMLQSAGSSGTVALANGVVADLVTSSERGSYIAFATIGSMLGPSLSPVIGGLISQYLNWHWIFWFLLILGGIFFIFLALFFPETCRKVVGDGSVPPPILNTSLTDIIRQRRRVKKGICPDPQKVAEIRKDYRLTIPSPWPTLKVCFDLESMLILLTTGLMFACFYAVMTGATTSFHEVYHFNNIQTGLMYLPIGAGGIASAFSTGTIVDWNYRRHAKKAGMPVLKNVRQDLRNFNIERVRLEVALPMYYMSLVTVIAYGWVLGRKVNLAAPVILLFICGWSLMGTSQVLSALMVDIWPGRSASATAANNLFRCELGAAASAAISPMTEAMGSGWAYTTLALIALAASPCFWIMMKQGIKWRQKRLGKKEESEAKKSAMEVKA